MKIGYAVKKGQKIEVCFDRKALKSDIFTLVERKNNIGNTYYDVEAKSDKPNYLRMTKNWAKSFENKHKAETRQKFCKWLYK